MILKTLTLGSTYLTNPLILLRSTALWSMFVLFFIIHIHEFPLDSEYKSKVLLCYPKVMENVQRD